MKIQLVVTNDGWDAHKAGCADLKKHHPDFVCEAGDREWSSQHELWLDANFDFIAEGGEESAWQIDFKNCTRGLPKR